MKTIVTALKLFVLTVIVTNIIGCNQVKLSDKEATELIVKTLTLPHNINRSIICEGLSVHMDSDIRKLTENGHLKQIGNFLDCKYDLTETSKQYLVKEYDDCTNDRVLEFHCFDVELNSIEGVLIDKERKTARVRFSLKPINITPIGKMLSKNADKTQSFELIFQKFDNGWQLATQSVEFDYPSPKDIFLHWN